MQCHINHRTSQTPDMTNTSELAASKQHQKTALQLLLLLLLLLLLPSSLQVRSSRKVWLKFRDGDGHALANMPEERQYKAVSRLEFVGAQTTWGGGTAIAFAEGHSMRG
jgi:hypothetical protein